jgi:hypothetical protein
MYEIGDVVEVEDRMQRNYGYRISAPTGECSMPGFEPRFAPAEMLALGVFEGKYCNDCTDEFPADWFTEAQIGDRPDPKHNYFGVKSRQPLSYWQAKGWIIGPDPRGWFQWYCRYYLGRRLDDVDLHQIQRWRSFARHAGQIRANCEPGDIFCRRKQRQALLQWSHDPFI